MRFVIKDSFGSDIGTVNLPDDADYLFTIGDRVLIPTPNVRAPWRLEVQA